METLLIFFAIQGAFGAFDTIYHHELTERLPWRQNASYELKLHGIRNFFYSVIFLSLAWLAWEGIFAWVFALMLAVEVIITLMDFVEEDRTRSLPASERVTHTILALNYGAILALLFPVLWEWSQKPSGFTAMNFAILSWIMTFYAVGVFIWGWRDLMRGLAGHRNCKPVLQLPALNEPNQHILVTGGTGFIGKPLCQALIDQGHRVTVLTRSMGKAAGLFYGRVTLIDSLGVLKETDHFDVIIHLAGESISRRWSPRSQAAMLESRLKTADDLIRFVERTLNRPAVFIGGSAIGVYGTDETETFTEETPPSKDAIGAFPRGICEQCERKAEAIERLGVRACRLRTGVVLESDGGALAQMLFPFEFGLGGPMGNGRQWFSWIHRDDLIRLIFHLINEKALSGPVNATAPEPVTNKRFSRALGKAMRRPCILPLPAFQVKLLFGKMGQTLLLAGQKVLPQKALKSGFDFLYPTLDKAFEEIFAKKEMRRHPAYD